MYLSYGWCEWCCIFRDLEYKLPVKNLPGAEYHNIERSVSLLGNVWDLSGFITMWELEIIQKNLCMTGKIIHYLKQYWSASISQTRLLSLLSLTLCFSIRIPRIFPLSNVLICSNSLPCDRSFTLCWCENVTPHWAAIVFSWLELPAFLHTNTGSRMLRLCVFILAASCHHIIR